MGKLLIGRYGEEPSAESIPMSLKDCHLKLGLRPTNYVSEGEPDFFNESDGAFGKYLVFKADAEDMTGPLWKPGYYLLPVDPGQALNLLKGVDRTPLSGRRRPVQLQAPEDVPPEVLTRAKAWVEQTQSSLMDCECATLEGRVKPPFGLRRQWNVSLGCPKRCQPVLKGSV